MRTPMNICRPLPVILLLTACVLSGSGCSGDKKEKVVVVTGKVTRKDKPVAGMLVTFVPQPEANGNTSTGTTDENGEYKLKGPAGEDGAWVGRHKVMIDFHAAQVGETDERPPRGGWPQKNKVPEKYNKESKETFDVPPEGTDKADFTLKTR